MNIIAFSHLDFVMAAMLASSFPYRNNFILCVQSPVSSEKSVKMSKKDSTRLLFMAAARREKNCVELPGIKKRGVLIFDYASLDANSSKTEIKMGQELDGNYFKNSSRNYSGFGSGIGSKMV